MKKNIITFIHVKIKVVPFMSKNGDKRIVCNY